MARRLVLVHGFTQTSGSLGTLVQALARREQESVAATPEEPASRRAPLEILAVDLPGHGNAPAPLPGEGLAWAARSLGRAGGRAAYAGYSMGARLCLRLAIDDPTRVESLVLIGATPGIDDPVERAARKDADEALAAHIETTPLDAFLEEWLAGPLFAHLSVEQANLGARRGNSPAALAAALRALGTGAEPPMWQGLADLRRRGLPVLLVAGERDEKFTALARRMAAAIGPNAALALVAGCGHAVPAERPSELAGLIGDFLAYVTARSRE